MTSAAKTKPLKKRHVDFEDAIDNTVPPATVQLFSGASNVEPLEPLDIPVREEDAAVLQSLMATGDISAMDGSLSSPCFATLKTASGMINCASPVLQEPTSSILRKCIACPYLATTGRELKNHYRQCVKLNPSQPRDGNHELVLSEAKVKDVGASCNGDKSSSDLFECRYCNFYTRAFRAFTMHIRSHQSEQSNKSDSSSSLFRKQSCPRCGVLVFNLRNHAIQNHTGNGCKNYVCTKCRFVANLPRQLKQHMVAKHNIGSKIYKCRFCEKEYAYLPSLYRHQLKHFADRDRLYPRVCPLCQSRFRSKGALNDHMVSKHTSERDFICDNCNKGFATRNLLAQHKIVHIQSNAVEGSDCQSISVQITICDNCGREFKRPADYRKHLLTHTGEKPLVCRMGCDKRFSDASGRKRHERTHTGEKPYACDYCGMRFVQMSGMRAHVKAKHANEVPISVNEATVSQTKIQNESSVVGLRTADSTASFESNCQPSLWSAGSSLRTSATSGSAMLPVGNFSNQLLSTVDDNPEVPGYQPAYGRPIQSNSKIADNSDSSSFPSFVDKIMSNELVSTVTSQMLSHWPNEPFASCSGSPHPTNPCVVLSNPSQQQLSEIPISILQKSQQQHQLSGDLSAQSASTELTSTLSGVGTARPIQVLACDAGVLSVLRELISDGKLVQCSFCPYIASSVDALTQHIGVQHGSVT